MARSKQYQGRYRVVIRDSRLLGEQQLAINFRTAREARQSLEHARAAHGYSPYMKYKVLLVRPRKRQARHRTTR